MKRILLSTCALLAVLAAALLVLWFRYNAPPGALGHEFPNDLIFQYCPLLEYACDRIATGNLPLWNPYNCCGAPSLAAAQIAALYPATWLGVFLPTELTIQVLMFGQILLAGVFAACFFRARGAHFVAALIGGVLFMFACMLGQTYWLPQVSTILWLPFLFWTLERYAQTHRTRWWLLLTVGTALQILAGFAQFFVYTMYLLIPYGVVRIWQTSRDAERPWRTAGVRLAQCGIGLALAAALAAPQILPTRELTQQTVRRAGMSPADVHYLENARGIPLYLGDLVRNACDPKPKMITFDYPDGSGYLGIATFLMGGLGLLVRRKDTALWLLAGAGLVVLILSFGYSDGSAWLYRIYHETPLGDLFRTPTRFRLLLFFIVITLAVGGYDQLCRGWLAFRGADGHALLSVAGALLLVWLAVLTHWSSVGGVFVAGGAFVLCLLAWFGGHNRYLRVAAQVLLLVFVVADVAHATDRFGTLRQLPLRWTREPSYWRFGVGTPDAYERVRAAAALDRMALAHMRPVKPVRPLRRGYFISDYEPLTLERWASLSELTDGGQGMTMQSLDDRQFPQLYDLCSVQYIMTPHIPFTYFARLTADDARLSSFAPAEAPPGTYVQTLHNTDALPRTYLAAQYEVLPADEVRAHLVAGDFDHHHTVLLERDPQLPTSPTDATMGSAEIRDYAPEHVTIDARTDVACLLVLTDSWYPGWIATVDGVPTEILRANYVFRAVPLAPGRHTIEFDYRPASFHAGLGIAGGSALILLVVAVRAGRRRRAPAATPADLTVEDVRE